MQLYNDQIAVPSDNVAHNCSRPLVPMDGYQREFWKLVQIDQASGFRQRRCTQLQPAVSVHE